MELQLSLTSIRPVVTKVDNIQRVVSIDLEDRRTAVVDRSSLISELHSEVGTGAIAALKVLQHTLTIDMEMALVGSTGTDFDYTHVMILEISQCRRGCCCRYSIRMDLCHSGGKQIVSMHTKYGAFGTVIRLLSSRNGAVVMERNGIVRILDHAGQTRKVLEVARG